MYYNTFALEKANRGKGMRISVIAHLLLLLIAFFYYFQVEVKNPDPDKPYRIYVQYQNFEESSLSTYAHADVGESRPKSEEVELLSPKILETVIEKHPEMEIPKPQVVIAPTPPPTPTVNETVVEESPVVVEESPQVVEKPIPVEAPVVKPSPEPAKVPTPPAPSPSPPKQETSTPSGSTADTGGKTAGDKPASKTDGNGSGKSNTGTGPGSDSGPDKTSGKANGQDGSGSYDGSGNGIFGRKVVYRNYSGIPLTKSGKIVMKVCINRSGNVVYVELLELETTIRDRETLRKTLIAARGYKFESDTKAPAEECGKLSVVLDINAFKIK
ncbi:MAG TPA: hypothetical protein PLY70_05365 [Saprospiraceae bacterium]|nr:hypothetical protein [Saprospiraceae bacterium]HPN71382.1 hypothetical protein [Saprospiraceae bacterium]